MGFRVEGVRQTLNPKPQAFAFSGSRATILGVPGPPKYVEEGPKLLKDSYFTYFGGLGKVRLGEGSRKDARP